MTKDNRIKNKLKYLRKTNQKEMKILCKYCELNEVCKAKQRKEYYEKFTITRCMVTPNQRKPKKRNNLSKKK
ncbi:MAG: hypothetical protein N2043_02320 [Ignavibacterium sp.]|nr:hypothetical protein [Ignavibacterium sp.]